MENSENKYKRGKIYKLISIQTDLVYYGSTIEDVLTNRLSCHRRGYKSWLNSKCKYVSSYEIVKYEDCKIILVEPCPCNTKYELISREQWYIGNNECVNKHKAYTGLSQKDYSDKSRIEHIEEIKEKRKHYRSEHKYEIKEQMKQYRSKNSEIIKCRCGSNVIKYKLADHFKTKKHKEFVETDNLS